MEWTCVVTSGVFGHVMCVVPVPSHALALA